MDFGNGPSELRNERGISQGQLDAASGVSNGYASALERGLKDPTLETLVRLARGSALTAAELVTLTVER
jgi:transcriptional regulator with XRE-family HTH domain